MISVGLRSTRLQRIWGNERTEHARGTRASCVSHTLPRWLDFRMPGHMLKKSKIPSTANRDRDTLWLILPSLLWHRGKREGFIEVF